MPNIITGATPTDYETATSHTITVRETLAGATNSPRDTVLTINVTDVTEVDTTAPVLSSPTGTKTGSTTATLTVSTDEANGRVYGVHSVLPPTPAQIKSGQMSTGAVSTYAFNQLVTATGVQTKNAVALTAATSYTMQYMHEDAAGNQSNVASASAFTTDAAAGGSLVYTATANPPTVGGGGIVSPVTFTAVAIGTASADRRVVVSFASVGAAASPNADVTAVTVAGVACTKAAGGIGAASRFNGVWYTNTPVATGTTATVAVTISGGTGWNNEMNIAVGTITGSASPSVASQVTAAAYPAASTNTNSASVIIPTGGVAVFASIIDSSVTPTVVWSSAITDFQSGIFAAEYANFANKSTAGTATETQTVTLNNGVSGWVAAVFQP